MSQKGLPVTSCLRYFELRLQSLRGRGFESHFSHTFLISQPELAEYRKSPIRSSSPAASFSGPQNRETTCGWFIDYILLRGRNRGLTAEIP